MTAPIVVRVVVAPAVQKVLDLTYRLDDASPVLRGRIYRMALDLIRENFLSAGASGGQAWPPLKPATIREKVRQGFGGKGILRRTDRLFNSLTKVGAPEQTVFVTPKSLRLTTLVPYAPAHQFGLGNVPVRHEVPDPLPKSFLEAVKQALRTYYLTGVGAA